MSQEITSDQVLLLLGSKEAELYVLKLRVGAAELKAAALEARVGGLVQAYESEVMVSAGLREQLALRDKVDAAWEDSDTKPLGDLAGEPKVVPDEATWNELIKGIATEALIDAPTTLTEFAPRDSRPGRYGEHCVMSEAAGVARPGHYEPRRDPSGKLETVFVPHGATEPVTITSVG